MNAILNFPRPENEPIYTYAPGTSERNKLQEKLEELLNTQEDIPMVIGGKNVFTDKKYKIFPPHDIHHCIGEFAYGDSTHIHEAISSALSAAKMWRNMPWHQRAAIFLKAADLISTKYRYHINAATMLCQSKNAYQAEIDAVCELADFLRFNVHFMEQIYAQQPYSPSLLHNSIDYRPLEGFVLAITPFNFTAIAGNLCAAPALMGNVVVWKPADTQAYSAHVVMKIFQEAGLPDGVINMIFADGATVGDIVFSHPDFAGLHFTGSSSVFTHLWKTISQNLDIYKNFPRVVGETGGKDFVLATKDVDIDVLVTALIRGAYEYQGQKCSAASRAYIPESIWPKVKEKFTKQVAQIKVGKTTDFSNFVNAVISEAAFDKITSYIERAKATEGNTLICGGNYDKSKGFFIAPTAIESRDPRSLTMREEIFGPVLTIYIYNDDELDETLSLIDNTSNYALTGAIFSKNRQEIAHIRERLTYAAGNLYINDKPTGAVVGQQPFGGARSSGTNDKAGSYLNLLRWVSPRTIKENYVPPSNFSYPFMD
jgi:1-pyrroline-5-carboxylate dehydrogenase